MKSKAGVILEPTKDHDKWARIGQQSRASGHNESRSDARALQSRRDSERSQTHPLRLRLRHPDHHWCEQNLSHDIPISTSHKRKERAAGAAKGIDQLSCIVVTKLGVGKCLHRHGSYVLMVIRGFYANAEYPAGDTRYTFCRAIHAEELDHEWYDII